MKTFIFLAFLGAAVALPTQNKDDKIVWGYACQKNSNPYLVSLSDGDHICGGSLIGEQWVLTAAHCYDRRQPIRQARLGERNIDILEGTEQFIDVDKFFLHPQFNKSTSDNDIMLIKLKSPATINSRVSIVNLPNSCPSVGAECLVSGWGNLVIFAKIYPAFLQCLDVPVVSDSSCKKYYPGKITSNMFCLGFLEDEKDSCDGESGGPVVCNGTLQGIGSLDFQCASRGQPGIYTKVCNYVDWIEQTIAANFFSS